MLSRRLIVACAALIAGGVIAACGASSTTSDRTGAGDFQSTVTVVQTVTAPQTTTTTTATGTTSTAATTTTTTATGTTTTGTATNVLDGVPECVAADLTPSFLGTNGAAGTIAVGFALTNSSSSTCSTYGWPGVELIDSAGSGLSTDYTRTSSDILGSTPADVIKLAPGQEASFRFIASDFAASSTCNDAGTMQIIAPNDTATMTVTMSGGLPACGKATLSPMMTGTSAWPNQ